MFAAVCSNSASFPPLDSTLFVTHSASRFELWWHQIMTHCYTLLSGCFSSTSECYQTLSLTFLVKHHSNELHTDSPLSNVQKVQMYLINLTVDTRSEKGFFILFGNAHWSYDNTIKQWPWLWPTCNTGGSGTKPKQLIQLQTFGKTMRQLLCLWSEADVEVSKTAVP